MDGLLEAVLVVASGLELDAPLRRIVQAQAAVGLGEARDGALGVLGGACDLAQSSTSASNAPSCGAYRALAGGPRAAGLDQRRRGTVAAGGNYAHPRRRPFRGRDSTRRGGDEAAGGFGRDDHDGAAGVAHALP